MKVKVNEQIEVNQALYNFISNNYSWLCAYRTEGGKFFIKLMIEKYDYILEKLLKKFNK